MGWTSYHTYSTYKNGKQYIDRKAECDDLFNTVMSDSETGREIDYEVLKSAMVGRTYYAAVQRTMCATETEPERSEVFAAVVVTSIDRRYYYNFMYNAMDETVGPCECKCPKSILDLLTPTDNECAKEWRRRCYEYRANSKR